MVASEPTHAEHDARHDLERRLEPILSRRSSPSLSGPAPTPEEIHALLRAATTVPDHGRMRPWRLVVVAGDARVPFGEALAAAARRHEPGMGEAALDRIRSKAFLAPALIAVAACPRPNPKVPDWEQIASAACAGYAIALSAHLLGLGAIWKSSVYVDGPEIASTLDLAPGDRLLGWVNVGHPASPAPPRAPADLETIARRLGPDGRPRPYGA